MKIELIIDEKERTFTAPFVSARKLRTTMEISSKFQKDSFSIETLDTLVDYLVDIYGKQFTQDDLYDGFPANKLFDKALADIDEVIGNMGGKLNNIEAKN